MSNGCRAVAVLHVTPEGAWHTPSHMCKAECRASSDCCCSCHGHCHHLHVAECSQPSCVWKLLLCYSRLFYRVQWLMFRCEKYAKVQCQIPKMLPCATLVWPSSALYPVFDSTVTCCALPQSPSLLSCERWMMFWECIRFMPRKNIPCVFLFDAKVRRHALNGGEKGLMF